MNAPLIIGVDGRSGSGKSTLAAALAARIAPHARVGLLPLESMYPGWDGLSAALAPDGPYVRALADLAVGRPAAWCTWDWHAGRPGSTDSLPAGLDVVVCEGVGSICAAARPFLDLAVWRDLGGTARRERALARDGDAYASHWDRWAAQEDAYLAADRPREAAHLVLRG